MLRWIRRSRKISPSDWSTKDSIEIRWFSSQGDDGDKFYIVGRGRIEISTTGQYGEKLRLAILGPGDHFGESCLLENRPHAATAKAITDSELLVLGKSDFEAVLRDVPDLKSNLIEISDQRQRLKKLAEEHGEESLDVTAGHEGETDLARMFVDYETEPEEYPLNVVQSIPASPHQSF